MTYLDSPQFFDVGIFAETLYNIDLFSSNIYLTQVLVASIEQQDKIKKEYDAAKAEGNEALMEQKEIELKICEGNFTLASTMFSYWEKVYS